MGAKSSREKPEPIDPQKIDTSTAEVLSVDTEEVENPFELTSKDFLDFACDDLKGTSTRDTVNALGNIKRSIDCLFDSLLFTVGFLEDSKRGRWGFPEKVNFLGEIGIITPYILRRINSTRNLLEHEFKKPNRPEVEMAYDIATLLYYATFRFTRRFFYFVDMAAEYKGKPIALEIRFHKDRAVCISDHRQSRTVTWNENMEDYKRWLKVMYEALYID